MNLKKDLAIVGGLFLLVVVLLIFGRGFTTARFIAPRQATPSSQAAKSPRAPVDNKVRLSIKDLVVYVDVAKTKDERQKGLSGRDSMPFNQGMHFVFDAPDKYAIWMKDMKFPIDIIWIDDNPPADGKKIVDIVESALPEPGKKDEALKIYRPKSPAKYILEINAGLVKLNNVKVGDTVNFTL